MTTFSQHIPIKYGVNSYQDTKNTYDWIMKSLNKGNFENLEVKTEFTFYISEITCTCTNIEEFVDQAYRQNNYRLSVMRFSIKSKGEPIWFISVDASLQVSISVNSKILLEKIIDLLETTSLDEAEVNDPISVTYVEHQESNITFTGNNNIVANNSSTVATSGKNMETESKISQWLRTIAQNLLANGIWYLLCLAVGAIIAIYFTKN